MPPGFSSLSSLATSSIIQQYYGEKIFPPSPRILWHLKKDILLLSIIFPLNQEIFLLTLCSYQSKILGQSCNRECSKSASWYYFLVLNFLIVLAS